MSIAYIAGAQATGSAVSSLTPTLPAHLTDDFFAVLCGRDAQANNAGAWSTVSSGWTLLDETLQTGGRDRRTGVFFKRATSDSEANPQFDMNATDAAFCLVLQLRGVDTIGDGFDVVFSAGSHRSAGTNDTTPDQPDITTLTDGAVVICFHHATHDDITVCGPPTDYTCRESRLTTDNHRNGASATREIVSAGAQTIGSWTHTSSPTNVAEFTCHTLALKPLADASSLVPSNRVQPRYRM